MILSYYLIIFFTFLIPITTTEKNNPVDKQDCGKNEANKFIIDTDGAAEDAVGILLALGTEAKQENIKIAAITTVSGRTEVGNATENVLEILSTVNRDNIAVYQGSTKAILGNHIFDLYYGSNGFGDYQFPNPAPQDPLQNGTHAVNALVQMVSDSPDEYTIIALGPLTNIALAIQLYPNFLKCLKNIFIAGGTMNGHGTIRPGVDFNILADPEATSIVLNEARQINKKIYLIPNDISSKLTIDGEWRRITLGAINSPSVNLLNKIEPHLNESIWHYIDALTVFTALNESCIIKFLHAYVNVELCGNVGRGALFVDYKSVNDFPVPSTRIVKNINETKFKNELIESLSFIPVAKPIKKIIIPSQEKKIDTKMPIIEIPKTKLSKLNYSPKGKLWNLFS